MVYSTYTIGTVEIRYNLVMNKQDYNGIALIIMKIKSLYSGIVAIMAFYFAVFTK